MALLSQTGFKYVGGYANTFDHIPGDWELGGDKETDGFLDLRSDLDPESYAAARGGLAGRRRHRRGRVLRHTSRPHSTPEKAAGHFLRRFDGNI